MLLSDYHYDLPNDLIGQFAIEPRDSCRLMVLNRQDQSILHHTFRDLSNILDANSILVLNDTKVIPARLIGKKDTGGKTEILLLKQINPSSFRCLVKGKVKKGTRLLFLNNFFGEVTSIEDNGEIDIKFNLSGVSLIEKIDKDGKTPLPPYIHSTEKESVLRKQYQTIYAHKKGSAAAPTAGLHFTAKLLKKLELKGIKIEKVTLHVGLGTFKPVTAEQLVNKSLHSESYFLNKETAERLNKAKASGKKIIAVGTTTCRVLETLSRENGILSYGEGETHLFIQPGYKFKFVDGLITNFHLPSTSLLMLVSAFTEPQDAKEGFSRSFLGNAYKKAIEKGYKFFSFGDAMLIR